MAQSWVEKLKRIDVSAEIAHEFFVACQESDLDSVKSYIEDKNLNVNTKDLVGYGQTALHYACWNGSLKLVEYLLSKEASVDALNDYKQTPLHEAAFRGHPDIVSLLLKSGADKLCKDHVGETALDYAKKKRNEATNFTSESLYKDVIKCLDSHMGGSNPRKRKIPCCFQ
ncbi:predicted protein [Naegleria gruberi]|uniref:Predicted protein n=1 Tax=Naegleria gruberi TaxID=5762 RepID=D2VHH5_NAEGR|nr:uncharacterized protein NAEGRDRAFT_34088 [Naegleria gruberi]EFC43681.1 predicted protein [Naegleria gruberi]|eukprot:XP_002676425.1 predicted protein [Naegleria gruberi strain NEG-M]